MHIVSKFQYLIHIFSVVKHKNKNPKLKKNRKKGESLLCLLI